ncbi:ABC transporter substrate-binding protein [Frigidibacter sp. ROC022]|uniref:ABC transporter substrate-binding protein n=1 Tax=Frigidibacter sp. ROC022 TaxID=2971796 RepID=UPI00215A33BB|nr:ABC transporter substrate-binding protein [Frigidibacter sp. ROC022]MCR8725606.1 polyamine ABC transporter substrate-binding protein [Frigidibacter sp. ROC022]
MNTTTRLFGSAALALTLGAPALHAADPDLLVYDYSGFEYPSFHSTYIAKNGDSPSFTFFGDEEEALQKVLSGFKVDVAHICAGSVNKWTDSGVLEPWDTSKITFYDDLDKNLTGEQVAGADEDVWFIPTDFGSTAISYNADKVPAEDVASLDVFLNPKYEGRTSIADNVDDAYALAYLATGVTDWRNITEEQFQAASAWLREAHKNLRTYWVDPAEVATLLATGEVLVAWTWNETLPTMVDEGFPIGFQRDAKEGSSLWLCGLVNLKDGPGSEEKVYDYANAFLDPSSTQALMDAGWGQANKPAMDALGPEALEAVGLGPTTTPVLAQLPLSVEWRQRHSDEFEKIKAGF